MPLAKHPLATVKTKSLTTTMEVDVVGQSRSSHADHVVPLKVPKRGPNAPKSVGTDCDIKNQDHHQ